MNSFGSVFAGPDEHEDLVGMLARHPLFDDYWDEKCWKLENIDVPMFVQAGWCLFHSPGSFDTFRKASGKQKWLRVTPRFEWFDLYEPTCNDDLQKFFDRFCKGILNGWEQDTPPVRLSLNGGHGSVATIVDRPEKSFPLERQQLRTYYLDASSHQLVSSKVEALSTASHEAHSLDAESVRVAIITINDDPFPSGCD